MGQRLPRGIQAWQDRHHTFSRPWSTPAALRLSTCRFLMMSVASAATAATSTAIGTTIAAMSHAGVPGEEEPRPADVGVPAPKDIHPVRSSGVTCSLPPLPHLQRGARRCAKGSAHARRIETTHDMAVRQLPRPSRWVNLVAVRASPEAVAKLGAGAGAAGTGSLGWQTTLLLMVPILA